jgi:glycosyltransferase involved in cell wall biosynthesis
LRIAISLLNYRPGQIGGAETYLKELLAHLSTVKAEEDEIFLLGHQDNARQLRDFGLNLVVLPARDMRVVFARCMEAFTPLRARFVERELSRIEPDVVLFPQQSIFPKRVNCACVLIVHDLQHLYYPRRFSFFDRCFRASIYPFSMRRAERIIAVSEWTRRTIIERCDVAPEKVVAVQTGFSPAAVNSPQTPIAVEEPYLYYPAATYSHKGHKTLLDTYARLRRRGDFPFRLKLSGQQTSNWKKLQKQASALGIGDDVVHLGFLPSHEVVDVYQRASAVVFPSEFEGFGIPVLEAVRLGKKIVCSRLDVFDEIGVPRQFQIDFSDPDQLLAALQLPGPTVLLKEPMTWEQSDRQILSALRETARLGRTKP